MAPQSNAIISGRVLDGSTGAPIANATVTIVSADGSSRVGPATTSGDFVMPAKPGRYLVSAQARGFLEGQLFQYGTGGFPETLDIAPAEVSTGHRIYLWRASTISGTVRDEKGDPVARVRLRALRRTPRSGLSALADGTVVVTDDRGVYRITGVRPGDYVVAMLADARERRPLVYHPASPTLEHATSLSVGVGDEVTGHDFTVPPETPTFRVSGQILGRLQQEQPALVWLVPYASRVAPSVSETQRVTASPTGEFAFASVWPGQYLVYASHYPGDPPRTGYVSRSSLSPEPNLDAPPPESVLWGEAVATVIDRDVDSLALTVQRGSRVTGRVSAGGGEELFTGTPRLGVIVSRVDGRDIGRIPLARVERDGTFRSVELPAGQYVVAPWLLQFAGWYQTSVEVNDVERLGQPIELTRDVTGVVITLSRQPTQLSGAVLDIAGKPVSWAKVCAFAVDPALRHEMPWGPARLAWIRSDDEGKFRLSNLPPGDYYVAAIKTAPATEQGMPSALEPLIPTAKRVTLVAAGSRQMDLIAR